MQDSSRHKHRTYRFHKLSIRVNSTGAHETMHMRMNAEVSTPCVKGGNDGGLRAQISWIGEELFERLPGGGHKLVGEQSPVELPEDVELFRHGEDDVSVVTREQVARRLLEPVGSSSTSTLGTTSMSAGVEFDVTDVSTVTTFEMRTEVLCATVDDGGSRSDDIHAEFPASGPRGIIAGNNRPHIRRFCANRQLR